MEGAIEWDTDDGLVIGNGSGQWIVQSGKFTPTATGILNVAATTAGEMKWSRIGNIVTVSGGITVDPTAAAGAQTIVQLDLPIASNFGASADAAGVCSSQNVTSESGAIYADAATDTLRISFNALSLANHAQSYVAQYEVIP